VGADGPAVRSDLHVTLLRTPLSRASLPCLIPISLVGLALAHTVVKQPTDSGARPTGAPLVGVFFSLSHDGAFENLLARPDVLRPALIEAGIAAKVGEG
jgi:hypothetical protein